MHGRTIDYVGAEDDGSEPSRQVDAARRLVEEEVFAVVPVGSTVPAWTDVFCEAVVPAFGWGTTPAWCNTTIGFGITGCLTNPDLTYNSQGIGPFVELLEGTDNTVAMIGIDSENARLGMTRFTETFERAGVEVVYAENILSAAEPIVDPSPVVNEIMTSNDGGPPAMVYQVIDFANTSAITQGLVAAGYEGKLVNAVGYDPRLAGFEGFRGLVHHPAVGAVRVDRRRVRRADERRLRRVRPRAEPGSPRRPPATSRRTCSWRRSRMSGRT